MFVTVTFVKQNLNQSSWCPPFPIYLFRFPSLGLEAIVFVALFYDGRLTYSKCLIFG